MRIEDGIQDFLAEAGQAGCYALCLLSVAQEFNEKYQPNYEIDYIETMYRACESTQTKSPIYYNHNNTQDNDNFYVQNPEKFLNMLTGRKWRVTHELNVCYDCGPGEYAIQRFERNTTGSKISHFQRDNFKPQRKSLTVENGRLKDLRVCRVC